MASIHKIRGKDLVGIGYKPGPVISIAMQVAERNYKHSTLEEVLEIFKTVLASPAEYLEDAVLGKVADQLVEKPKKAGGQTYSLNEQPIEYKTWGTENIEESAVKQMDIAARLPISVSAALMSDSHQGYGIPIGGVLATTDKVICYAIGVDIACSLYMSIFDINESELSSRHDFYKRELIANTLFGTGACFKNAYDHPINDRKEFNELPIPKQMKDRAIGQTSTSGGGNHFVEFGVVDIHSEFNGVKPGKYLALLSHSGSRGLGATIAGHYTKIAKEKTILPKEAANLAWLDLNSEEGMEYWLSMNFAGDYAAACHEIIHEKIARAIKAEPLLFVGNRHNFAWKEMVDGNELIVHRKGATPAGKGVLGIIPGSMTAPGYIVMGKGNVASLNSASHGAGRAMSRTAATNSISGHDMRKMLADNGVTLIGGGIDEAPQAYKDIDKVMEAQQDLVEVLGKFYPKIVRMNEGEERRW